MKVALGIKTHSGWAAVVVVGKQDDNVLVVDRRRIELVNDEWQKQPYHAAENLKPAAARALVKRGVASAMSGAVRELRAALKREQNRGNGVTACAVLVGEPMPNWSTEEILAVHFRMHKAEGVLFRDALVRAAETCGVPVVAIPEKDLLTQAEGTLGVRANKLTQTIVTLGKSVGPPWGSDQKDAALAAWLALQQCS